MLGDGGYLLELEKRGYVQAGPFTPEVVIEHPDALVQLHREFLRAGVDVLQTMTFYASDDKLATVGLEGKVDDINRNAVQIARQVAAEGDALVAGNLCLTWAYDPADPGERGPRAGALRPAAPGSDRRRRRGLLDRRDVLVPRRGDPVRRAREGDRASGDGDDVLRTTRARLLRGRLTRRLRAQARRRRRRHRRGQLPERARADAADRRRDARSGVRGTSPRNRSRTAPRRRSPTSPRPATSPTSWIHCSSPARRWESSPGRPQEAGLNYIGSCCGSVQGHVRAMAKVLGKLSAEEREWKSATGKAMSAYEYREHSETEV